MHVLDNCDIGMQQGQVRMAVRPVQGSVWGSGLAGMLCAITALTTGTTMPWQIGFVASFVSKLSDTVSSEIGKASLCKCSKS